MDINKKTIPVFNNGVQAKSIYKVGEGRSNILGTIKNKEVDLIINTPLGKQFRFDGYEKICNAL